MQADEIARVLRERDLRVTAQRRAILQAFRDRPDEHLSAEEVLARASVTVPEIGRGTVYSALAELTELGLLASVGTPEPVRYETNLQPHDHFHCRRCVRLFDIDLGERELDRRVLPGYEVERVAVRVEGICSSCQDYVRGLRAGAERVLDRPLLDGAVAAQLACAIVPSPLGDLVVAATANGIVRLAFEDHADFAFLRDRADGRSGPESARDHLARAAEGLEAYFAGSRAASADAIDWQFTLTETVPALTAVREIPYAEPRSYHRLSEDLTPFDCGQAMGANATPLIVPCHRVSCGEMRMEAYVGGAERLSAIRQLESEPAL